MDLDFVGSGFHKIFIKDEGEYTHIRTNARDADDVSKWKDIFCAQNKLCFNVHRNYVLSRNKPSIKSSSASMVTTVMLV